MFWNTFNEICLTKEDALNVLNKCKQLLNLGGKILINSDNRNEIDSSLFDYSTEDKIDGMEIKYNWKTMEINKNTNTTTSMEIIRVKTNSANNLDPEIYETTITQRWWSLDEYKDMAHEIDATFDIVNVKQNDELYLVFTPKENE